MIRVGGRGEAVGAVGTTTAPPPQHHMRVPSPGEGLADASDPVATFERRPGGASGTGAKIASGRIGSGGAVRSRVPVASSIHAAPRSTRPLASEAPSAPNAPTAPSGSSQRLKQLQAKQMEAALKRGAQRAAQAAAASQRSQRMLAMLKEGETGGIAPDIHSSVFDALGANVLPPPRRSA